MPNCRQPGQIQIHAEGKLDESEVRKNVAYCSAGASESAYKCPVQGTMPTIGQYEMVRIGAIGPASANATFAMFLNHPRSMAAVAVSILEEQGSPEMVGPLGIQPAGHQGQRW